MSLFIPSYIENLLKQAEYEYDTETESWCAMVQALPGAYAQADSVEEARTQLAEVIEDYILVSLHAQYPLPGFKTFMTDKLHA